MTESDFSDSWSHREAISAVISLSLPTARRQAPPLVLLGYELHGLEIPMVDYHGQSYTIDLHLFGREANQSLSTDVKTYGLFLKREQLAKYMSTDAVNFRGLSNLTIQDPSSHRVDAFFVAVGSSAVDELPLIVRTIRHQRVSAVVVVELNETSLTLITGQPSDSLLADALEAGITFSQEVLELERLPYEPDSPDWLLADIIFQDLFVRWLQGVEEFTSLEVCRSTNSLWDFYPNQQRKIEDRIRGLIKTMRKTALKGWVAAVLNQSSREEHWKFTKKSSNRASVLEAFARRHQRFVSVRRTGRDPVQGDFVGIDTEQYQLVFEDYIDVKGVIGAEEDEQ